jgi:Xaa-Pro aminopeptidase
MDPPFDYLKLDKTMSTRGVDFLLATSPHNVQYLLGGYRFFFFEHFRAIGTSCYLPCVGYCVGDGERTFYIGNPMEDWQLASEPVWPREIVTNSWTSTETADSAAGFIRSWDLSNGTIAIEASFLPADAEAKLKAGLPDATFVDAFEILEELRAVKSVQEIELLSYAADAIVDSMESVISAAVPGTTRADLVAALRREEVTRGLLFEYCAISTGRSGNRYGSSDRWESGCVASLDSGGSYRGYIGDLCRMACMGSPTTKMKELLAEIDAVQLAARAKVLAGEKGEAIYGAAATCQEQCPHGFDMTFVAHGMGLVSHEAPRLSDHAGVPYPATHASRALEPGMVLSLETHILDEEVGFIKLEDTVVVTDGKALGLGDRLRSWNLPAGCE